MKTRVCAYARVSTNSKSQEHSFEFQSAYWNETLSSNPDFEYVGLYADKGISGKFEKRRPQFMAMLEACRRKEIDRIYCKSVQRFARNAEELLRNVRELRELHIGVIFEKERIDTTTADSDLYLTVAAAIAQDDLTRFGQNIEWTIRDKFKKGENVMGWVIYGYNVIANSKLVVNPEQAKIVKEIFELYATNKYSGDKIAKYLNEKQIATATGAKWSSSQILAMIRNEKYKGDVILQKFYTDKGCRKKNKGKKPMYYIENNHEAIVDKELWEKAQEVYERRSNKKLIGRHNEPYAFTGLIECGICGCHYIHKVNNSGTPFAQQYWNCSNSIKNGIKTCNTTGIKDSVLKEKFVEAYNEFVNGDYKDDEELIVLGDLQKYYGEERELMQLNANKWILENDFKEQIQEIREKIIVQETKLRELRSFHVSKKDYNTIDTFKEEKLLKFIRKVTISRWMVTFEFYNGVVLSKSYTNGTHGMIQDWTRKHRGKKHE